MAARRLPAGARSMAHTDGKRVSRPMPTPNRRPSPALRLLGGRPLAPYPLREWGLSINGTGNPRATERTRAAASPFAGCDANGPNAIALAHAAVVDARQVMPGKSQVAFRAPANPTSAKRNSSLRRNHKSGGHTIMRPREPEEPGDSA